MKFTQYLSETEFMDTIDFNNPFKVLVDAPTGGGKTNYIVNYLKEKNIPFVFLTDTLLLMNQISSEYGVPSYSAKDRINSKSEHLITVYNHIAQFYKDKVIVIDESHSLVADYDFKKSLIDTLLIFIKESPRVLLLSGTPVTSKNDAYKGFTTIKCQKSSPKRYDIDLHRIKKGTDKLEYTVALAVKMKKKGLKPVISLLNTNSKLNELIDLLKSNGFDNVGMINSVTKDNNGELDIDSTHYEELVTKGTVSADCIITTYVQGYNINNENCGLIIVPSTNKHTYLSIAQMVARFRKMETVEIHLIANEVTQHTTNRNPRKWFKFSAKLKARKSNSKKRRRGWSSFNVMWDVISRTTEVELIEAIERKRKEHKSDGILRYFFKNEDPLAYLVEDTLEVNHQMLALDTVKKITHQMYKKVKTANIILNQYNIFVKEVELTTIETMEKQNITTINYEAAVDLYFNYLEVGKFYDTTLGYKIHKKYLELKNELHLSDNDIKRILKESAGNEKAYNRVILSYRFRISTNRDFVKMREQIFKAIKVNQWYSSQQIFDIVSVIIIDNGGECDSKNRASETLNFLFETEEASKRIDGVKVRGFNIKRIK